MASGSERTKPSEREKYQRESSRSLRKKGLERRGRKMETVRVKRTSKNSSSHDLSLGVMSSFLDVLTSDVVPISEEEGDSIWKKGGKKNELESASVEIAARSRRRLLTFALVEFCRPIVETLAIQILDGRDEKGEYMKLTSQPSLQHVQSHTLRLLSRSQRNVVLVDGFEGIVRLVDRDFSLFPLPLAAGRRFVGIVVVGLLSGEEAGSFGFEVGDGGFALEDERVDFREDVLVELIAKGTRRIQSRILGRVGG